jgi:AraC family transcriptional regulator
MSGFYNLTVFCSKKLESGLGSRALPRRVAQLRNVDYIPCRDLIAFTESSLASHTMTTSDGYGERLCERLRVDNAPAIVTRTLRKAEIAVTEIRCDDPSPGMTSPVRREDAFLVGLSLRDFPQREYWEDGRQTPVRDVRAGDTCIHDLKRDPIVLIDKPCRGLFFYLPRAALNAIADDASAPRIGDLDCRQAAGVHDATVAGLGSTMLPAFSHPQQANRLFVDHVTLAVGAHVAQAYGGMRPVLRPVRGGLAPWQARRATEILNANLDGDVPIQEVARQCGLSVSHFSRAFRRTTGMAPHQWLLRSRIEAAKAKLRDNEMALSDVALACGFADQSHLTRVFTRIVGISPGAWRRAIDE